MAANQLQMSIFEKVGEKFAGFAEGFTKFISKLFGYTTHWQVKQTGYIAVKNPEKPYIVKPGSTLERINNFESQMQALSDAELKELSTKFRARLAEAKSPEAKDRILEEILPE